MSYFSRLTDIVTCNLSELIAGVEDPSAAIKDIIEEIQAGVEAAQRSVKTAAEAEERIRIEIDDLSNQHKYWADLARQELKSGREDKARLSLMRKNEVGDLIAGLKQQHTAAESTLEHLTTTLHALEARLADAIRRRASMAGSRETGDGPGEEVSRPIVPASASLHEAREQQIEAELAALKRELDG